MTFSSLATNLFGSMNLFLLGLQCREFMYCLWRFGEGWHVITLLWLGPTLYQHIVWPIFYHAYSPTECSGFKSSQYIFEDPQHHESESEGGKIKINAILPETRNSFQSSSEYSQFSDTFNNFNLYTSTYLWLTFNL